eukprot:Blabericola_migrator_1__282@NODE_1073_length_5533_cov_66_584157_g736_i0_p2_GENE_NODE_1073_length_5533_cov_66_584157_g736_i0NODE_1073_length_5533_cov_66_584157_g736_i0_p2_ORF_typecomplete_len352_score35_48Methyltr_RsmBF/PF01189_17/4_3e39Methyltransf_31/PF13847_6/2_1e03Methyltransf_31/PF13847_6/8_5e12Methyltransf_23/PF13489_6/8_2e02Methyltransf_23/PF13489_6/2_7e08MTS/PF05175_14/6_4e06MTS/PF05175_14/1_5e02Methyltransf_25/PF13649_6/7_2e02Methyltransf_25/PF13649_6/0_00013Ubie_methyltran/PF01209_18/7_
MKDVVLPPVLWSYLKTHDQDYEGPGAAPIFRYFRLNVRQENPLTLSSAELVSWLPSEFRMYQCPANTKLAEQGPATSIYGMDAASAVPIWALQIPENQDATLLDLCCAPGNKAFLAADVFANLTVFAVDVSVPRLEVTRKRMLRYGVPRCVLLKADGTTFNSTEPSTYSHYCRNELKKERRNRKKVDLPLADVPQLFDRVLVDAECTHDGSTRHIMKFEDGPFQNTFDRRVMNRERLDSLFDLQYSLLKNGYNHLKPGGILVYSTCSLSVHQNERVVQRLLDVEEGKAELVSLPFGLQFCSTCDPSPPLVPASPGQCGAPPGSKHTHGACLFHPQHQVTSGLFLCAMTKVE